MAAEGILVAAGGILLAPESIQVALGGILVAPILVAAPGVK